MNKVKTHKKIKMKGIITTTSGSFVVLNVADEDSFHWGSLVVPENDNRSITPDGKYLIYGMPRLLFINYNHFLYYQEYEKPFDILVWDGDYIEVPDGVEPEDYFITDEQEEEFAIPVTQDEFDRIFDTYYDKESE